MIRQMIALLVVLFAVALGADAYFGQQSTGWPRLDQARSTLHEQVGVWTRQGIEWWDGLQPRQRTLITGGSATAAIALLALGLLRRLTATGRRIARRLRSISVPYFSYEVGEAGNSFLPEAAVYPESQRLRVTTEIVSDDWDSAPEPPLLVLRLIAPGSGQFFDREETGRPTTPHRFQAVFDVDNLVALRQEPGHWTAELLVRSEGQQSPVLTSRPVHVFDSGSLLDDLQATRFDVISSSGSIPETNGLLVADGAEQLLVHAVVATTHADASKLPSLQARLTLSRPDGSDAISANLPLNFDGPSAVLSHVELCFPLTEGRRPASNWVVRLQVGSRILAQRTLGVATRAQLGELAEVVDLRLLRAGATNGPRQDIGELLRFQGSNPQALIPVARVRTPAPSSRHPVNVTFAVLRDNTVVNALDQQHALGRNDNWVVGGEWTLSPPPRGQQRYCIAISIDGRVCGERTLTVNHQELRVTDAQGQLVDVGGLPDNLDADADAVLSGAATVRL